MSFRCDTVVCYSSSDVQAENLAVAHNVVQLLTVPTLCRIFYWHQAAREERVHGSNTWSVTTIGVAASVWIMVGTDACTKLFSDSFISLRRLYWISGDDYIRRCSFNYEAWKYPLDIQFHWCFLSLIYNSCLFYLKHTLSRIHSGDILDCSKDIRISSGYPKDFPWRSVLLGIYTFQQTVL